MATPTSPGSTIGEQMTAGDYTWEWNGYGWDLVQAAASGGVWNGAIEIGWTMRARGFGATYLDYV